MKIRILILLFPLVYLNISYLFGQNRVFLHSYNEQIITISYSVGLNKKIKNEKTLEKRIKKLIEKCQDEGFYAFSVDSISKDSFFYHLYIHEGEQYKDASIYVNAETKEIMQECRTANFIKNGIITFQDYNLVAQKCIQYLENHGFPFAEIYLDSLQIQENSISAQLKIDKNSFIVFDSIIVKGDAKIKKSFLYPYLGLKSKQPYNESVIKKIPNKCKELAWVTQVQPSGIEFVVDKAYLYLFLNKKRTNSFNGYIGIVPEDREQKRTILAGELNLNLVNIFGIGESMEFLWKSPQRYSQQLKVNVTIPYLFRTQFGINSNFLLDKIDTSYLSINFSVGVQHSFHNNSYLKGVYDFTSSQLLLPKNFNASLSITHADFRKSMYGIEYYYRKVDFIFNPKKGIILHSNLAIGKRKILQNREIPSSFYEGIETEKVQYRIIGSIDGFIPLHKRWVLMLGAKGGALFGGQFVENELFKIGGLKTLRGFNENEILASSFLIGTTEIRFLFAKIAYFNLFFDGAWYEKKSISTYVNDTPFGFGMGIAFETKAGIFYLNYGLGKQFKNPIEFKNGKINFGLLLSF